jgi:hypothetical protein
MRESASAPAPERLFPPFGDRRPEATLTGPPRTPWRGGAPFRRLGRVPPSMRARHLLAAVLCALAAAGCGGSDSDSGSGGAASSGEDLYREYACAGCHSLDGDDGTGPTFKGLAGSTVTLEGGETVKATREYLRRAIVEPDAEIVEGYSGGLMPATTDGFDLESKPGEVDRLVDFIESVK